MMAPTVESPERVVECERLGIIARAVAGAAQTTDVQLVILDLNAYRLIVHDESYPRSRGTGRRAPNPIRRAHPASRKTGRQLTHSLRAAK